MDSKLNAFLKEKQQIDSKLKEFLTEKQHFDHKLNAFIKKKQQLDSKLSVFLTEKQQLDFDDLKDLEKEPKNEPLDEVKNEPLDEVKNEPLDEENKYILYFDGASKGNPGPSGAGAVLYSNEIEIGQTSFFVGKRETNNVAEYNGLITGLKLAIEKKVKKLLVRGDSKLVICQMKREWKVKAKNLLPFNQRCKKLENEFTEISYEYVPRKYNSRADELANIGVEL